MEAELEVSSIKSNTAPPRHPDTDVAHQTQTKSWSSTRLLSEDRSLLSPWVTVSGGGDHLTSDVMFGSLSPVHQHSVNPQTKMRRSITSSYGSNCYSTNKMRRSITSSYG